MGWKEESTKADTAKNSKSSLAFDPDLIFKPAIEMETVDALFISVFGRAKVGKTFFTLTAKPPIYIVDTEMSTPILVKQLPEDLQKQVHIVNLLNFGNTKDGKVDVVEMLESSFKILSSLVENKKNDAEKGTIVIDSMSDVYLWLQIWLEQQPDLVRSRESGKMLGTEWSRISKRWKELIILLRKSGWNIILTFKARAKWGKNGAPTEIEEAKWQSETFHDIDLNIELTRIGTDHIMKFHGGRFGDTYDDLTNASWPMLCEYITKKSGVKIAQ